MNDKLDLALDLIEEWDFWTKEKIKTIEETINECKGCGQIGRCVWELIEHDREMQIFISFLTTKAKNEKQNQNRNSRCSRN